MHFLIAGAPPLAATAPGTSPATTLRTGGTCCALADPLGRPPHPEPLAGTCWAGSAGKGLGRALLRTPGLRMPGLRTPLVSLTSPPHPPWHHQLLRQETALKSSKRKSRCDIRSQESHREASRLSCCQSISSIPRFVSGAGPAGRAHGDAQLPSRPGGRRVGTAPAQPRGPQALAAEDLVCFMPGPP